MKLVDLIDTVGYPKILIDYWDSKYIGYACYDYEETMKWTDQGIFINDKLVRGNNFKIFQNTINQWKDKNRIYLPQGILIIILKIFYIPILNFKIKKVIYLIYISLSQRISTNMISNVKTWIIMYVYL